MFKPSLQRYGAILFAMLLVAAYTLNAGKPTTGNKTPDVILKTNTNDYYTYLDINNIFNMFSNNGDGSYNKFTAIAGLEWPKGTAETAIFEDGFMWAGYFKKDGKLYADGSVYRHGWQAGRIDTAGTTSKDPHATSPDDAHYRVYRVRPDVNPHTPLDAAMTTLLSNESSLISRYDASASASTIYAQYILDWDEWPVAEGAPYKDVDSNGVYNPAIDIPGVPGADQTLWHVSNDMDKSRATGTYGSSSVGIELQRTIWAYNRFGPLGNALFMKYRLINKSGYELDTVYTSLWSDPDLGDAGDDFVGCDTLLSLGFVYNGKSSDAIYGSNPPASGYDFFQGPIVPSATDTAIFDFKLKPGYKNLPMSSFNFFINGNALYTDPTQGAIAGTTHWYNLMRGLITTTGAPNIDPTTGKATKFAFYGDPVGKTGWVDGKISSGGKVQVVPPGDRRLCMTAGPFTMAVGDTQEVVVATLVAQASDNLRSVSLLKYYDQIVQAAYNDNFDLAPPPARPNVTVAELNGQIVLDWGDVASSAATESQDFKGFKFEGYNVYQLKSNSFSAANAARLATYDLDNGLGYIYDLIYDDATGVNVVKPVQFGTNTGITRQYITSSDGFSGQPLVNGRSYFYAVTSYNYNPNGVPKSLESAPTILQVIPQSTKPGTRYSNSVSQVIPVTHTGLSQGHIAPVVIDPTRLNGHLYKVWFDTLTNPATGKIEIAWSLKDSTSNTTAITKRNIQSVDGFPVPGADNNFYTLDGVEVKVVTEPAQMQDGKFAGSLTGTGRWSPKGGEVDSLRLEGLKGAAADLSGWIGNAYDHWTTGTTSPQDRQRNVVFTFAATDALGVPNFPNDPSVSYGYRYLFSADKRAQPGAVVVNKATGLPFQDFTKSVPFAAYDVESIPPRRLAVGYTENNQKFGTPDGKYWPPAYNATSAYDNNRGALGPMEWFFVFDVDYSTTLDSSLVKNLLKESAPIMWLGTPTREVDAGWTGGDSLAINRSIGNGRGDVFTYRTASPSNSLETAKSDVDKINVFPNPYFGFNK